MNTIMDMWIASLIKWEQDNEEKIKSLKDGELLRINGEGEPNIGDIALNNKFEKFRWCDNNQWLII